MGSTFIATDGTVLRTVAANGKADDVRRARAVGRSLARAGLIAGFAGLAWLGAAAAASASSSPLVTTDVATELPSQGQPGTAVPIPAPAPEPIPAPEPAPEPEVPEVPPTDRQATEPLPVPDPAEPVLPEPPKPEPAKPGPGLPTTSVTLTTPVAAVSRPTLVAPAQLTPDETPATPAAVSTPVTGPSPFAVAPFVGSSTFTGSSGFPAAAGSSGFAAAVASGFGAPVERPTAGQLWPDRTITPVPVPARPGSLFGGGTSEFGSAAGLFTVGTFARPLPVNLANVLSALDFATDRPTYRPATWQDPWPTTYRPATWPGSRPSTWQGSLPTAGQVFHLAGWPAADEASSAGAPISDAPAVGRLTVHDGTTAAHGPTEHRAKPNTRPATAPQQPGNAGTPGTTRAVDTAATRHSDGPSHAPQAPAPALVPAGGTGSGGTGGSGSQAPAGTLAGWSQQPGAVEVCERPTVDDHEAPIWRAERATTSPD